MTTDAEHFGLLGAAPRLGREGASRCRARPPAAEALDAILGEVGPRTRLIAVSHVLWINGHVIPIEALRAAVVVPLLVDGAQSVGAIPVEASPFDFYTVSGQKWLCGPAPTGGLYVKEPERLRSRFRATSPRRGTSSTAASSPARVRSASILAGSRCRTSKR